MDDRTHIQYSLAILGLIYVKQWHQRERDEAVQRSPDLQAAQFAEGPDDHQDAPRGVLSDALVVRKELGEELEYGWIDVRQEVLVCCGEDSADSVYGDG